ncbi:MAG: adenylate kinase [Bacteroidales bacterium]|jgi:adenylate kinase|nr:adenylate kinase [Bacteroidales bacterium]
MLNIILFGPPGSGKGTQSKKITEKYNLVHISTGDALRNAIIKKTSLGIEAQKLIDDGNYVTDEMAIEIIKEELDNHECANGFVFDGFPRTTFQAEQFPEILFKFGTNVNLMISIVVDENILIERLLNRAKECDRPDDREEEIIYKRLEIYNETTACVKDYYKSLGKYESIEGNGEIDGIFDKICTVIEKYN